MLRFLTWEHPTEVDDDKFRMTTVGPLGDFPSLLGRPQGGGIDRTNWEGELQPLTKEGFSGEPGTKVDKES